jgi:hypothetical protein
VVLHWNGSRWRSIRVPWWAPAFGITAADQNRAWLGSFALWTGRTWLMGSTPVDGDVAVVPGTRSAWAAFPDSDSRHQQLGRVDYNGPKP